MKGQSTPARPRYEALISLLRTAESLWNASRVFFAGWNLSPSQFNVLSLLHDCPGGCSQIELSRRLIMHRSNVTGLLDRLQARRLVLRRNQPGDRRAFNVVLSPAGRALIRRILPSYHRAAETVWTGVSPRRARRLVTELASVSAAAERLASAGTRRIARGKSASRPGRVNPKPLRHAPAPYRTVS